MTEEIIQLERETETLKGRKALLKTLKHLGFQDILMPNCPKMQAMKSCTVEYPQVIQS